jgi:hypothetical protein
MIEVFLTKTEVFPEDIFVFLMMKNNLAGKAVSFFRNTYSQPNNIVILLYEMFNDRLNYVIKEKYLKILFLPTVEISCWLQIG